MRDDSVGLFWEDKPKERSRGHILRSMPPIPETNWRAPNEFPNLAGVSILGIDTETCEPDFDNGPGWARGLGHIVGVSVATTDAGWYFPVRHSVCPEQNLDPDRVFRWLADALGTPRVAKVGANLLYDIGWLKAEGVVVDGPLVDVQFAEALLTEREPTALDSLGEKYVGAGKDVNLLYRWLADYYGGKPDGKQRGNIHRAPPSLVGPYAERDARLPLAIIDAQFPQLEREGLVDLFRMECELIPLLVAMRFAGTSVNIAEAERVRDVLRAEQKEFQAQLKTLTGVEVNVNAAATIARAFDAIGLTYPKTAKSGKPSFKKEFLEALDHPVGKLIREIRSRDKLVSTFIESYILERSVGGKIFCSFHPLRGDEGGTRSGRFSSSDPNLQNIPARDERLAPLLRGIFVPDPGHVAWRRYDYSQIEYRLLAHFAVGPLADAIRAAYNADPHIDYHHRVFEMLAPVVGWDTQDPTTVKYKRKLTKNVNFGLVYGMGIKKLVRYLGLTPKQGDELFKAYHKSVPFVQATMDAAQEQVQELGYMPTILGRRSRFDMWEPADWELIDTSNRVALPYRAALDKWGSRIKRAYGHKGLNRKLQGSAADIMKRAMWQCWKSGVFNVTGVPRLTIHDELDHSQIDSRPETLEAFEYIKHTLETAIPLRVPVVVDVEVGNTWGEAS
jgi:DNA polymerase I-like protein with 3'-5' exonuclease and polymerase domains